jgi:hypothetical protein
MIDYNSLKINDIVKDTRYLPGQIEIIIIEEITKTKISNFSLQKQGLNPNGWETNSLKYTKNFLESFKRSLKSKKVTLISKEELIKILFEFKL